MKTDLINKYNNTLNETSDRFSSLLVGNKERILRTAMNVILTIVVLAIFGCFDFVNMEWDWTRLFTYAFWTKVSSKTLAAICCFNIGINLIWEVSLASFFELKEEIEKYDILIRQKDDENFEFYTNQVFNLKAKKNAWINKINRKIYRLDKFTRTKHKLLYTKKIPLGVSGYESQCQALEHEKLHNKYCIRRKELEALKTDEYIDANIDNLVVKYSKVNASAFSMDISGKIKDENNNVTGNVTLGKVKATANIVWGVVLITSITSAIVVSLNQERFVDQMQAFWYYCLNAAVDIGIVAWNIFRGTRSARPIMEEQIHRPYVNRNKVLTRYIGWREENNIQPSKSFIKINKLIDEENNVVEMTKEEYEKTLLNKCKAL